jgi:membrane protease YdiL (CAAX protease family)
MTTNSITTIDALQTSKPAVEKERQYSLGKILGIWALVALPMWLLAWVVTPAVIPLVPLQPGLVYWLLIIAGMTWQFVVSLVIIYRELGTLRLSAIRRRTWLNAPLDPISHQPNLKLFWWLLPCLLFDALISFGLGQYIDAPLAWLAQLVHAPLNMPNYADISQLARPEFRGQWWILGIALLSFGLNYFLGEEFLFRGVLLPKMGGVFGRWDWVANAVLFGFYHLHKPWMIPSIIVSSLAITWPARRFQSTWMAIIVHGAEGIIVLVMVLGVILGLVAR